MHLPVELGPRKGRAVNAFSIFKMFEIEVIESEREWVDGWMVRRIHTILFTLV